MSEVTYLESPSQREFERHVRPPGLPLVITGWMKDWPAMEKWTFEFFQEKCGEDIVVLSTLLKSVNYAIQVPLAHYVDYILRPEETPLQKIVDMFEVPRPFYCYSYRPFERFPELLQDFHFPAYVDTWFRHFHKMFRRLNFPQRHGWIHLGTKGTVSELHTDSHAIITCLAQVRGSKRFVLFAPEDSPYLYKGAVDPLNPDHEKYPLFGKARPMVLDLKAGELIWLPPNWWHHVVSHEPSITMVWPMVNQLNLGDYILEAYKKRLPRALRALPAEVAPPAPPS